MRKSSPERLIEWSEKIKDQKLSNKTAPVWCRENRISYNTFQYWLKKITGDNTQNPIKNSFFEIPEECPSIEISLPGVKLSICRDFDRNAFVRFLSLLKVE